MRRSLLALGVTLLLTGCGPTPAETSPEAVALVQAFRPASNGLTASTLVDLQTYPGAEGASTITSRQWTSHREGNRWLVSYQASGPDLARVWQWTVDLTRGTVLPANEEASRLNDYARDALTRLGPAPSPVAVATPTPGPAPSVTVTVTTTLTPSPAATQTPAPVQKPAPPPPRPTPPPPPPAQVEYKGVMQVGGQTVATVTIDGQYYQAYPGGTIGDDYHVVRITPQDITLRHGGQTFTVHMAPHSGIMQFTPALEATPSETPAERPTELQPVH